MGNVVDGHTYITWTDVEAVFPRIPEQLAGRAVRHLDLYGCVWSSNLGRGNFIFACFLPLFSQPSPSCAENSPKTECFISFLSPKRQVSVKSVENYLCMKSCPS